MLYKFNFLLLSVALVLYMTGCAKEQKPVEQTENTVKESGSVRLSGLDIHDIGLKAQKVLPKSFSGYRSIPAKITVNQDYEAHVGSLVPGKVQKVLVNTGDYVKAGQTVMIIEGLEIGEIKADYYKSKAAMDYAENNYKRQKELLDENIGSKKSFLEAQSEYEKSKAEFKAADEKIHSVGFSDEELSAMMTTQDHVAGTLPVKSPISGMVVERNVVVGQTVDVSSTALKIMNTRSVWIDGQIYEKDASNYLTKTTVQFKTPSYPQECFSGRMMYIGQVIDEKTRTILIRCEFDNPDYKLKPQMFGELIVPTARNNTALVVPAEAIVKIDQKDYVFVQTADTLFEQRPVVRGITEGNEVEITDGLKEGDWVVVKGAFYLKSEMMKSEFGEEE